VESTDQQILFVWPEQRPFGNFTKRAWSAPAPIVLLLKVSTSRSPFSKPEPRCAGKRRVDNAGLLGEILVDALHAALAQPHRCGKDARCDLGQTPDAPRMDTLSSHGTEHRESKTLAQARCGSRRTSA
jgi:hypothetical protein